jgi:cellulose synthase/poly-beta-1,6-N-acetylglucosamine synthase-like glycosyltransferase
VAAVFYTYLGYPVFVYLLSRIFGRDVNRAAMEPTVSVIITAYNEEKNIRAKLENTLSLNYPKDKIEVIVASDGSTDGTDEIVGQFESRGVRLYRKDGRVGKTDTQNGAVATATGEVLLFSDATTLYQGDVLRALVPNFADPSVGCVAGKLIYLDKTASGIGTGAKSYWSYETFVKEGESRLASLIGVSGCLYAVRRSAYVPMYAEACSDFMISMVMQRQRLRTIFEPGAVCTEDTHSRTDNEFSMRVRIISQTISDLWLNRDLLNPFRNGLYAVQLVSHKVLRYAVPAFLLLAFVSSALLAASSAAFLLVFLSQCCFYGWAILAWILESRRIKLGLAAVPMYFVLVNLSSVAGFVQFVRGNRFARWETVR